MTQPTPPTWLLWISRRLTTDEHVGDLLELWTIRHQDGRRHLTLRALNDLVGLVRHSRSSRQTGRLTQVFTFRPIDGARHMWHDIRYAFRLMRRQALFASLTLLTLTLGIAASTSIFTTVDRLLWRPLPFPAPEALVIVTDASFSFAGNRMSPARALKELPVFDGLGLYAEGGVNVEIDQSPVRAVAAVASPGFFDALAVTPVMGHTYTTDEDVAGANAVAVISHRFWQQQFGGATDVLSRPLVINRRPFRITGVMPASFSFPAGSDVWIPSGADNQITGQAFAPTVIARIKAGIPRPDAEAALTALGQEMGAPESEQAGHRLIGLQDTLTASARPTLLLLAVSVGLVMLVATTNVAGLFLARVARRQSEFVVRLALGAGRRRLMQLMAVEAACYAGLAGVAGTALSALALRALTVLGQPGGPASATPLVDARMLGIALLVSALGALLFGVAPALASCTQPAALALRAGTTVTRGRRWRWFRHALVVGQVAGALVLLSVATATTNTLVRLANVDLGFNDQHVLAVDLTLPTSDYADSDRLTRFSRDLQERFSTLAGITNVGITSRLPGDRSVGIGGRLGVTGLDTPYESRPSYIALSASPDYFSAMGIRLVAGRAFTNSDRAGGIPVAVINETGARLLWPDGQSPIGQHVEVGSRTTTTLEIVGVVRDVRLGGPHTTAVMTQLYRPIDQYPTYGTLSVALRTAGDPLTLIPTIRSAISEVDASLPLYNIRTMTSVAERFLADQRTAMAVMAGFAVLALVLAGVGIYGVLAQLIEQQTREIGIRVALGAEPSRVRRSVTALALRLASLGILVGATGAGLAATLVTAYVPRLDPISWSTVGIQATVLLLIALAASWVPARRASSIDPIRALKDA